MLRQVGPDSAYITLCQSFVLSQITVGIYSEKLLLNKGHAVGKDVRPRSYMDNSYKQL